MERTLCFTLKKIKTLNIRTRTKGKKSQSISNIQNPPCFTFKKIKNIKHMYFQNKGDKGQKITKFCPKTTV